jgi:hypothetical protein
MKMDSKLQVLKLPAIMISRQAKHIFANEVPSIVVSLILDAVAEYNEIYHTPPNVIIIHPANYRIVQAHIHGRSEINIRILVNEKVKLHELYVAVIHEEPD